MAISKRLACKKRKGITSVLEAVISIGLFGMLLAMLMTVMAHINMWSGASNSATEKERDMDFLLQTMVSDIKSASDVSTTSVSMNILSGEELIVYTVVDDGRLNYTLYRNDEFVIDEITAFQFEEDTESTVRVYVLFKDGQKVDLTVRR